MLNTYSNTKEPDILEVISDLSNDEVFTPPSVAKQMLDLLPADVWKNSSLRWIDPFTKTGVFLREITKRLLVGLKEEIPDEQQRLEHILRNMVFGVAITELTSLMSRRSLYCSKWANSEKSVVKFPSKQGNLIYQRVEHEFFRGRCSECGGASEEFSVDASRENFAYALLHQEGRRAIEREIGLKFDIIVGNPPYQMDADEAGQNINAIYNLFVEQAMALEPSHICMIIPSRWMAGGKRLDDFRDKMLKDQRFVSLVDYPNANELFPSVEIKGGVSYFLWSKTHQGACEVSSVRDGVRVGPIARDLGEFDVFVRDSKALPILKKVLSAHQGPFLDSLTSTRDPFGPALSSNLRAFRAEEDRLTADIKCHISQGGKRRLVFIDPKLVTKNSTLVDVWKVLIPKAGSDGGQKLPDVVIGKPLVAEPGEVCSMTYLVVGPVGDSLQAENLKSYLETKFARFLVSLRKISQNTTSSTYGWVPVLEWTQTWSDEELFDLFAISEDEVEYINSVVKEF